MFLQKYEAEMSFQCFNGYNYAENVTLINYFKLLYFTNLDITVFINERSLRIAKEISFKKLTNL